MATTILDKRDCSLDASFSENDRYCYKDCIVKIHDNLIQCDLCNIWFHKKCASNKDQVLAEILASRVKSKIAFWRCQECFTLWRKLPGMFLNFSNQQKEIVNLKKQVCDMHNLFETEINDLISKMKQNVNNTESLTSEVKHLKATTTKPTEDPILSHSTDTALIHINEENTEGGHNTRRSHRSGRKESCPQNKPSPKIATDPSRAKQLQQPTVKQIQPIHIKGDHKILVLGSSLTRGLLQEKEPRAEVHCFPGITTVDLARKLSLTETPRSQPQVVILHVGGNNLANGQDPDEAIGDHWYLVEQAKSVFPNSKIVISGILFRRGLRRKTVKYVNHSLNWLSQCLEVTFVDLSPALPSHLYKRDGIHLNAQGVNTASGLLRNFCSALTTHFRDKSTDQQPNLLLIELL